MEVKGRIKEVKEVRQVSEKFQTQNFVLDLTRFDQFTGEEFPNFAEFQVNNGKCDLSNFKVGDVVNVSFFINGRFYENKTTKEEAFFQTLVAFKVSK